MWLSTPLLLACFGFLGIFATASPVPIPSIPKPVKPSSNGRKCTVTALGNQEDDVTQILEAFEECNNGGTVVFPEGENYYIATRLNPIIYDVTIEWRGLWTYSHNPNYWRNNSYSIAFQNHNAGFVITGDRIAINGYGTGGINGSGNTWYTAEGGDTQPGRPMPFVFWNVSEVVVEHFYVKDSPLWALNIMNGTNMWFDDIEVNSTAANAPYGANWVQNTDGFDTMDANNIVLTNFRYRGGDDCIAIKPRSYNISIQNVTCQGGNGIAIGSLGQYLEDSSVVDVHIKDVDILTVNEDMHNSAYIKTWIGELAPQDDYESDYLPRGGGWGVVENIRFENFYVEGAAIGMQVDQDSGNNGSFSGTSNMKVSNIAFVNFTGWTNSTSGNRTAAVSCSARHPCYNVRMEDISLATTENGSPANATGTCKLNAPGGVHGMLGSGCTSSCRT
ncbi:pectin lyase fold/virulence factor [Pseudomassariella vexata]|uniref:galacturonan 1,4-alpha-galacturonidase n=1 Tax=Pseudomassariella vexata TaxID=1141098 RepID=A0A1Y2E0G6_9PEZI|nr:pectin lyase fold/virulence factor [Pseudomassariella vexata]ORY65031.1 pectin lyase fold/virulence factor [Pseudomassariella vexata]